MHVLQTATEALNVSRINRVAYLSPGERIFLTEKTGRPDFSTPDQGEVIADIGHVIPVTLCYVDDELEGQLIVSSLTQLIAYETQGVIDFSRIQQEAREQVARLRAESGGETAEPASVQPLGRLDPDNLPHN